MTLFRAGEQPSRWRGRLPSYSSSGSLLLAAALFAPINGLAPAGAAPDVTPPSPAAAAPTTNSTGTAPKGTPAGPTGFPAPDETIPDQPPAAPPSSTNQPPGAPPAIPPTAGPLSPNTPGSPTSPLVGPGAVPGKPGVPGAGPPGRPGAASDRTFQVEVPSGTIQWNTSGIASAHGQIKITYRDGVATGQTLTWDPKRHIVTLTGNVTLQTSGERFRADTATLNYETRLWSLINFEGAVSPLELRNQVRAPIYLYGALLENAPGNLLRLQNGSVTSCDLPGPSAHYWVDAKEILVIPGDKLVLRKASFVLLGHRIFTTPTLVLSLRQQQRNQLLPEVGRNDVEGFYAKERYPLALGAAGAGLLLVDLLQKKGIGKGFDDSYRFAKGSGRFQIYQIKEKDTGTQDLSGSLQDSHRVGDILANFSGNFSQNSYTQQALFGSSQTSTNANLSLNRSTPFSGTSANISLSQTNSGFSNSLSANENLRQHFSFSRFFNTDINFTRQLSGLTTKTAATTGTGGAAGTPATTTTTPASGQDEYQLSMTENAPALTTVLSSDVHQPFGKNPFFFVERYPELSFNTTTTRLLPQRRLSAGKPASSPLSFLTQSPLTFNLIIGHYREEPNNVKLNRMDMTIDASLPQKNLMGTSLSGTGRFEQKMTSDGTAQYIINLNNSLVKPFSRLSSANLTYYRIQPVGYTPFQFDRPGNLNQSSLGVDLGLGQQPRAITTVANPGALGYLSPIGGAGNFGGYTGFGNYGSFGGQYPGTTTGLPGSVPTGFPGANSLPGTSPFAGIPGPQAALTPVAHLSLHTGFDFNAGRSSFAGSEKWSPLNLDLVTFPGRRVTFYASTSYDLNAHPTAFSGSTSRLSPIRGGVRWIAGDDRFLDTSYVYDPSSGKITTLRAHALFPLNKLWTIEALSGYQRGFGGGGAFDPYSGNFQQVLVTRDLHCWQANLYYSSNPQQINFSVSIKAFPLQRLLGVSKFGQLFNQGVGHTF